jgi:hypothetical protein
VVEVILKAGADINSADHEVYTGVDACRHSEEQKKHYVEYVVAVLDKFYVYQ